jgi:hypothetical protein
MATTEQTLRSPQTDSTLVSDNPFPKYVHRSLSHPLMALLKARQTNQGNVRSLSLVECGDSRTALLLQTIHWNVELWLTKGYIYRTPSQRHKHISDPRVKPGASHESWKFTPPLPDSNTFPPATFSNQPPAYSTPTAGGTNMLYCNEDVDPATPEIGMGIGIRTPRLLSTPGVGMCLGWMAHGHCCSPQIVQPSDLCHSNRFDPPQDLAPYYLSDQPPDFEPLDNSAETPPIGEGRTETEIHFNSTITSWPPSASIPTPLRASGEKYVYASSSHFSGQ